MASFYPNKHITTGKGSKTTFYCLENKIFHAIDEVDNLVSSIIMALMIFFISPQTGWVRMSNLQMIQKKLFR